MTSPTEGEFEWSIRTQGRQVPAWRTNYRGVADTTSPSTTEDTGQTVEYLDDGPDGAMVISGGRLTVAGGGGGRGFREVNAGAPVTRIGGRFTLNSSGTTTENAFIIAFVANEDLVDPNSPPSTFRIGAHVSIYATEWIIDKLDASTTPPTITQIGAGTFARPLIADGVTEYELDAYVVGDMIHVKLPDGTVGSAGPDADIASWSGDWGCHEIDLPNASDAVFGWSETWTDTAIYTDLPTADPFTICGPGELDYTHVGTVAFAAPQTTTGVSPGSSATIPGISVTVPGVSDRPVWLEFNPGGVICSSSTPEIHWYSLVGPSGNTFAVAWVSTQPAATSLPGTTLGYVSTPPLRARLQQGSDPGPYTVQAYTTVPAGTTQFCPYVYMELAATVV